MKDNTKQKKHKHHQTYSDSPSSLTDNEKCYKKKNSKYDTNIHDHQFEDTKRHHHHHHHHKKHSRKHKRSHSVDSDSQIEVLKEKKSKHRDDFTEVKIKQEPVSDNEDYSSRRTKGGNDADTR